MKVRKLSLIAGGAALAFGLTAGSGLSAPAAPSAVPAKPAASGAGAQPAAPQPVRARVRLGEKGTKVIDIVERKEGVIFYSEPDSTIDISVSLPLPMIEETEFELKYDQEGLLKAMVKRDWPTVSAILYPLVNPLVPYLDLKENNAIKLAYQAGMAMTKAGRLQSASEQEADKEKARQRFIAAYRLLKAISRVDWFTEAENANLNAINCLISIGNLKQAASELDDAREPETGDACYGLYWLVKANLRFAKKELRPTMDAIVKSLVFETKDLETFPDGLFLSARCYEQLLEHHRARDVYYEIARIFPRTEWDTASREKLQFIMDKGLTKVKEKPAIESVFFGLDEDMNLKANNFLKGITEAPKKRIEDEAINDEEEPEKEEKPDQEVEGQGLEPPPSKAEQAAAEAAKKAFVPRVIKDQKTGK